MEEQMLDDAIQKCLDAEVPVTEIWTVLHLAQLVVA